MHFLSYIFTKTVKIIVVFQTYSLFLLIFNIFNNKFNVYSRIESKLDYYNLT
jgi:hypothetical protein